MAAPYGDHTAGPPADSFSESFYQMNSAGYPSMPLSYAQSDTFSQDFDSFEALYMTVDHLQPTDPASATGRPGFKRALSSSDSVHLQPGLKKQRLGFLHRDSSASNQTARSTATSAQDTTESNRSSPSATTDASPAAETLAEKLSQAQSMAPGLNGQVPSVLLPALPRPGNIDHDMLYEQRDEVPARASRGSNGGSTRRSKAAAIQHLEEASQDEVEADSPPAMKLKGPAKRQPRKRVKVAQTPDQEEEEQLGSGGEGEGEEGKRAQFLERNRLAACKSRQKKKEWIKSLESQSDELTRQNGDLQVLVTALREEISTLRGALSAHNQCACRPGSSSDGSPAPSATPLPAAPERRESGAFSLNSWPTLPMPTLGKEPAASSTVTTSSGISFDGSSQPTGLTPFLNGTAAHSDADYFGQPYSNNSLPLNTPELARSLGFTSN